jgi:nucleotide-binding universal stress UspA family protein
MSKIKVLIPTDFSMQSDFAGLMAKKLAGWLELELHFIHIIHLPSNITLASDGTLHSDGEMDPRDFNRMKEMAEVRLNGLKEQFPEVTTHIAYGGMKETVVKFAKSNHFDLILMGTKGAFGLKEKLTGSETQHVVRTSDVPVLSVMCDRSDLEINNILLVHDFSAEEEQDLKLLKLILKATGARLHLLYVSKTEKETAIEQMKQSMESFIQDFGYENAEIHIIKDHNIVHGITHFNQMRDMDIICIGTHGRKGIQQVLYSSPVEKLVNHLYKPLITYHLKA